MQLCYSQRISPLIQGGLSINGIHKISENGTLPKKSQSQINKAVFYTTALLIFLLVAFAPLLPENADKNFKLVQLHIFTNASWFYILALALIF